MYIPSRPAWLAVTMLLGCVAVAPQDAVAQTPAQMEYDRQQREYWKQQEQQRQEQQRLQQQMNENARRQQEGITQPNAPTGKSAAPAQGVAPQIGSQAASDALEAARQTWLKRPPLPPDRNPLLGQWTRPATGKANSSDPFAALQALAKGGLCEVVFGGGTFEFRPNTLVGSDAQTRGQELDQVEYRGEAKHVVVIPKTTFKLMVFDFDGPDRINWSGQNCVLVRVAPGARNASAASSAPPQINAPNAIAPESSRKEATSPASPGATSIARAPVSDAKSVASHGTMLSLVAGLQYPSGKYFPLAGTTFYILKENLDAALARGGVQPPPGVSPLRAWLTACEAKQDAVCAQGNRVFEASTVATLRTDLQGQAELGTLNPGTYYVYGGNQRYQQRNVLWNVRVDMREGANNSVKLDQANVMAVN
jgi:hypothetical protein